MEQIGLVQYPNPGESKIHNKSATNLQQVQMLYSKSTANPQQVHNKSNRWSLSFSLQPIETTCTYVMRDADATATSHLSRT